MDEVALIQQLFEVARNASIWLLDNAKQVPPHVITVADDGTVSEPHFPHEHLEGAGWNELLEGAASHARTQVLTGQVVAVAVGVELENDGQRGVGIQVETQHQQLFRILPVSPTDTGHDFGAALEPDSFLFELLFVPAE